MDEGRERMKEKKIIYIPESITQKVIAEKSHWQPITHFIGSQLFSVVN